MELNQQDTFYFVRFILLGVTSRPSGKRQVNPMVGPWMARTCKTKMRGSDLALRRNVCIEALRKSEGQSVDRAAAYVGQLLGMNTEQKVTVIRVAYYDQTRDQHVDNLKLFTSLFLDWRGSVLRCDQEPTSESDILWRQWSEDVRTLVIELRKDKAQYDRDEMWRLERSQETLKRIESDHWNPVVHWRFLATDLWKLGRLLAGLGDIEGARAALESALDIWKRSDDQLPNDASTRTGLVANVRAIAIPALEGELFRLSGPPA